MATTNLQTLRDDVCPSDQLAKSCIDYITEVDRIIDVDLPAIKTALTDNLTSAESDGRFDAAAKAEIQGAIDKITANLAG